MNAKNFIVIVSVICLAFTSCQTNTQTSASLKSEGDTASFYIGYFMGKQLESYALENMNRNAFIAGINAALAKKDSPDDMNVMDQFLGNYIQRVTGEKREKTTKINAEKGAEFLAKNETQKGVVTTDSGLQYKIEKEGDGAIPTETSTVKVHYKGTLLDGTEFDSSYKRGEPATFPANGVIRGWTEALSIMPVGSKWTLYIPSELAYGAQGAGQMIEPNSTLIFEVELLEIVEQPAQ